MELFVFFSYIVLSLQQKSTCLTLLVQKSGSDNNIFQSSKLRPNPRPPARCTSHAAQRAASSHHSSVGLHTGMKSPIYNSSPHLSTNQQVQMSTPSFHPGAQAETSLCLTPSSPEDFRYSPTHRRVASTLGTSWRNL